MIDLVSQSFANTDVNIDFLQKLALATLIGILIGVEREHRRTESVELIAGVRSFTISCISGMLSSYLAQSIHIGILVVTLLFFAMISILFIYVKNVVMKQPGITGPIALYCTFLLGILISYDYYLLSVAGAVILTLLLAEKQPLHSFATNLTDDEILSAVRFMAVVFILFPITPDELFMGVLNPRWVLLIVIFVSTISFISFVIMKRVGTGRGIFLSGLLGGLVNSEATTGALASMARKKTKLIEPGYVGIILANASMLIRNLVIAFIVDPSGRVLLLMAPPQAAITLFAVATVIRSRKDAATDEEINLQSPFSLSPAIRFAFGFAGLSIFLRFLSAWAGIAGVYAAALGGFISSAVVTASVTALAVSGIVPYSTAALTAVLASIISTGTKIMLVRWSGPPKLVQLVNRAFIRFIIVGVVVVIIWGIFIT
ncbi:MAG: MgtC/SapB family protein [Candidatus Methanoperedenaceae archaeon]|nr:MgtC/SapB family protein [Candidatus Methanoperedenaceae archaeon]MDW7726204.1 MgtC/SapB family protein [Candidatus Methanoperedens sp.]